MNAIYRIEKEKLIRGRSFPAFIHNKDYYQTDIKVYADGVIDCWGHVDYVGFKKKVEEGWVVTQVPHGEKIHCFNLYSVISNGYYSIEVEELVKEVWDTLLMFKGKFTSEDICRKYFYSFLNDPTENNHFKLKKAYENVPKHNRIYLLGDQDSKDVAIKMIIVGEYGPNSLEEWKKRYFYMK